MDTLISELGGVVDQLNPLSRQNQIVYLVWLAAYVFTAGAVWRCGRRWLRLVFLLLLQVLSVGLFVSQANILILAIYLWQVSLAIATVSLLLSVWTFRRRKPGRKARHAGSSPPSGSEEQPAASDGRVTAVILAAERDFALQHRRAPDGAR